MRKIGDLQCREEKKVESLPELEIHSSKNYNNWLNLLRSNSAKKLQARAVKVAESSDLLADFLNNVPLLRKIANSSSKMDRLLLHLSAEIGKKKKKRISSVENQISMKILSVV
ncbi:hypothetical protein M3Y98_00796300 [Aphelenchoides besseyi]|nr:hypothetical protein M3Y98_00796300 [Aphelenchoides besseyi]